MRIYVAILMLLLQGLISCGVDDIQPAPASSIQKNKAFYQDFITEFNGVSRALTLTRLDQFAPKANNFTVDFNDYANRVEASPLFNREYDYIEGFLYRAGEEVVRTMVSTLLSERGLGFGVGQNSGIVEAVVEDSELGLYEYKIDQRGASVTGCDPNLVDCFVDIKLHVRIAFTLQKPTLTSRSGLLSYRFTLPELAISVLDLAVANSQIQLSVEPTEQAVTVEKMLFDFDLLSGDAGFAMNIAQAASAVAFELRENTDSGLQFNGTFGASLLQVDLSFRRIQENIIITSNLSQLDVQIEGKSEAPLQTELTYRYWSDEASLPDSQTYPLRLGLANNDEEMLPVIDLNWIFEFAVSRDSESLLALRGEGRKQNKKNFQIRHMTLGGELFDSDSEYLVSARIAQSSVAEIQAQASCMVIISGEQGVLIDPLIGAVGNIAFGANSEWIVEYLDLGD